MSFYRLSLVVLIFFLMLTALALVYVKHKSRSLFSELETLQATQHRLDENWGRLMLEQSVLLSHDMIEKVASRKLGMRRPGPERTMIIKLEP